MSKFAIKTSMIKYILNDYIIHYSHKILLQILCEKSCNHILLVHLTGRLWCGNRRDDINISSQIFIHSTSMINDKMTWMSKISFENVTIKSFKIWLKNNYANDVDEMMCHYIDNLIKQLFYNKPKMTINNLMWI
jgi:hypothetical protein